ncbi:MAG: glycerophosphodiester phosphodiesterase family protein [Myxococcota bacterium]|nr:glycerophosphodiester phosphodiesterase family protein [Myxococcota bacterium]
MDSTARRLLLLVAFVLALVLATRWLALPEHSAPGEPAAVQPDHQPEPPAGPTTLDVQGHRGARALRPENTLLAFEEALRLGVTTLELDLGVTADGAVVVAHDPFIHPGLCVWPDGELIEEESGPLLRDLRLEEVRQFDCGSLNPDRERFPEPPRENQPGARIPTLAEVFDLVRQRSDQTVRFNIEIKSVPGSDDTIELEEFVATVIDVVRKYDMVERTTIQAFDWRALVIADRIDSRLRMAALLARNTLGSEWHAGLERQPGESVGELLGRLDAKIDDFSPNWRELLDRADGLADGIAAFRSKGMRVIPWTVNDPSAMERLIELGVDGIITDRPDLLLELCRRKGIEIGT